MNIIKKLRFEKELTQEQLARLLHLDRSAVAKWETGQAMPRADKLLQLADVLGCTVDELLGRSGEKKVG